MNILESYSRNTCALANMYFDNPKVEGIMKNFQDIFGNTHLSYCVYWSSKIFKKELLRKNFVEYHDFIGYIKSERKNHGKTSANNNYSTVIEFNRDNQRITWKFNPSKSLRKKLSGAFRVLSVNTDGKNIHLVYSKNGKSKYIKFDYNNIEVLL